MHLYYVRALIMIYMVCEPHAETVCAEQVGTCATGCPQGGGRPRKTGSCWEIVTHGLRWPWGEIQPWGDGFP